MKRKWPDTRAALLLSVIAFTSAAAAHAQGTINFANITTSSVNAPVYESDGITKCSGPQFMAELLAGPSVNNLASIATTGFLSAAGAPGYFNGGVQSLNTIPPGATAWVQVDVWNTASGVTFDQAKSSGLLNSWWQSSLFQVQVGGGFQGPPPASLIGLGTSPVYLNGFVPEPSTCALAGLGTAMVLFRFRRRDRSAESNH